jgi:hypothetical protein
MAEVSRSGPPLSTDRSVAQALSYSRPIWSGKFLTCLLVFSILPATIDVVIRETGAPSIAMGRTPHELRDEMCPGRPALRTR